MSYLIGYWPATAIFISLLACNWYWLDASRSARRCVPGSLEQFKHKRATRMLRWPGFSLWPYLLVDVALDIPHVPTWAKATNAAFFLLGIWITKKQWELLRQQIDDDEDDWWNKAKRGGKRAWQTAKKVAQVKVPMPVPAPTGA